jgi:hypothetical protein
MNKYALTGLILFCFIAVMLGSCTTKCQPYYAGRGCAPVNQNFAARYAGSFIVVADAHANPPVPDTITISAGTQPDTILVNDVTSPIIGTVNSNYTSFNVPPQTVIYSSVPLVIQSGSGTLSGDSLSVLLNATSGGLPVTITYTGLKE